MINNVKGKIKDLKDKKKRPKYTYVIALICIILLALFIFRSCDSSKKKHVPEPTTVVVAKVEKQTVPIYTEYVASVDPSTRSTIVDIMARVEAFLMDQRYDEGKPVKKGQVLFVLDKSTYIAALHNAQAQLDTAKADLEAAKAQLVFAEVTESQLKPLALERAIPQLDYDNAVANLKVAKAKVSQANAAIESGQAAVANAKINLSYCTVFSPIDGVAGERLFSPGNLVGQGGQATKLTTVMALDPLRVDFSISENDYLKIAKRYFTANKETAIKPKVDLILADGNKYPHEGKIVIAEPMIDPRTGTITIVAEFSNPNYLLRPGMFARIGLVVDYVKDALIIPQKSVMVLQSAKNVYVVDNNDKVVLKTVELGILYKEMIVVTKGLDINDRVITEGQVKVKPGMTVNPTYASQTVQPQTGKSQTGESGDK
ncbi:MAG: efflux RND transporter periplasmic adaptor subunit [Armatimonadota bacterium]